MCVGGGEFVCVCLCVCSQGILHLYTYKITYILLYVVYGHWGECLVDIKMHLFCYQKDCTRSRNGSVHSYLTYDASRAHRRGRGDKPKKRHFLLVTTRLIAHSGQSQFFTNCVSEFSTDTG